MKKIITISREYGSGGREIGQALAERFGIPFYGKDVAVLSAVQSGLSPEMVEQSEDRVPGGLSYKSYLQGQGIPISDRVFFAQSEIIRTLAAQGPCVIVGRCADYVLRDCPDCIHLFIHAPLESRVRRIVSREHCSEPRAKERIATVDKNRAAYHDHYAHGKWGYASGYNFTIDSSVGIGKVVDIIAVLVKQIQK